MIWIFIPLGIVLVNACMLTCPVGLPGSTLFDPFMNAILCILGLGMLAASIDDYAFLGKIQDELEALRMANTRERLERLLRR